MQSSWVYILECFEGTFYTGSTNDLERRLAEHREGLERTAFTFTRRPIKLVFAYELIDIREAYELEYQIKGWSRAKKIALMNGDLDELVRLSNDNGTKKK